jgi:hypothetical protein
MAGRKARLPDFLLPALCMATIAAAFYLDFYQELARIREGLINNGVSRALRDAHPYSGLSALDQQELAMWRGRVLQFRAIGYLIFAVAPFLLGALIAALRRRRLRVKSRPVSERDSEGRGNF